MPQADLVLEGGGVKGLGLVGAVLHLLREGYSFPRAAGTSAGAIVAALLAAGADEAGLARVMGKLDYPQVPDRSAPGIPVLSEGVSLLRDAGAYEGDYIHDFIAPAFAAVRSRSTPAPSASSSSTLPRRGGKSSSAAAKKPPSGSWPSGTGRPTSASAARSDSRGPTGGSRADAG